MTDTTAAPEMVTQEGDWIRCVPECDNTPEMDGFYPCLPDGLEIEPLDVGPWENLLVCARCDRIINQDTLEVTGRARRSVGAQRADTATPDDAGVWIDGTDDEHNGALLILIACNHGWDGKAGDGRPEADHIFTLAQRHLAGDDTLTPVELDDLTMRYPEYAEQWLDLNIAADGCNFGWANGVFFYQSVHWWETETDNGCPDRMWL